MATAAAGLLGRLMGKGRHWVRLRRLGAFVPVTVGVSTGGRRGRELRTPGQGLWGRRSAVLTLKAEGPAQSGGRERGFKDSQGVGVSL